MNWSRCHHTRQSDSCCGITKSCTIQTDGRPFGIGYGMGCYRQLTSPFINRAATRTLRLTFLPQQFCLESLFFLLDRVTVAAGIDEDSFSLSTLCAV